MPTMAMLHAFITIDVAALLVLLHIANFAEPTVAFVLPPQQRCEPKSGLERNPPCHLSGLKTDVENSVEIPTAKTTETETWDDQVIRWVDGILGHKSEHSPFAIEKASENSVTYEWIAADQNSHKYDKETKSARNVALRTTGQPLLDADSIALIRDTAENLWEHQKRSESSSSRFTLQFEDTNSECHLEELVASDPTGNLQQVVDDLLVNKVYPMVRSAFGGDTEDRYGLTEGSLCVYDSLVVRYNGDKAMDRFGASQPLHGDGGVVSVNIALNPHRGDNEEDIPDTFSGGGTFFEDMIELPNDNKDSDDDYDPILRPSATGHALAHWSIHRHAGAPTRSGTRDILVIFLTQNKALSQTRFNGIERSFQLKLKARELPPEQREMALRCLDLAIEKCPCDAQAYFWKGFYLIQGGQPIPGECGSVHQHRWNEIQQSIECFEKAKDCAPFDAKISCYASMAYRQRWMFAQQQKPDEQREEDIEIAASYLERALLLHKNYCKHGISSDFDDNANTAKITLAEVYLQQKRYHSAMEFLTSLHSQEEKEPSMSEAMILHISKLSDHCHEQLEGKLR